MQSQKSAAFVGVDDGSGNATNFVTHKSKESGTLLNAASEYLNDNVRTHVIGAVQTALKEHPDQPLNRIVQSLRENNPNRDAKTIPLPTVGEVVNNASLSGVKHKRRRDRHCARKILPLDVEVDPTIDNMLTTIADAKFRYESALQADAKAVASGDLSYGASQLVVGGSSVTGPTSALTRRAASTDVTEFGKEAAAHLPNSVDRMHVFVITPVGREVVFMDGQPFLGDVAVKRSQRVPATLQLNSSGATAGSGAGSRRGGGAGGDDDDDKWNSDSSDSDSVLLDQQEEPPEDLEQDLANAVNQANLSRRSNCFPVCALQSELTRLFSKSASGLSINVTRLNVPSDRIQLSPLIIDEIDGALGSSEDAPLKPVVVFAIGFEQDLVVRNIVAAIATTLAPQLETKQLNINQLIQIVADEKKRLRIASMETGTPTNQFTMNPSGYWMKVRERREARDRRRDQMVAERKRRVPQMPIPSNLSEHDRAVAEAQRQKEQEEREAYLKDLDGRLHAARMRRQARRSREDVEAAEAITKSFAAGAVLVQSMIRGFLTRRRIAKKNLRRKSFRQEYEEATSPNSRANVIERYARNAHEGKHRNRIETRVPWAIEKDVLMTLKTEYPEGICSLMPRAPAQPKVFKTWFPERKSLSSSHNDDVSSEEESWICTSREVHPKLQTHRYRMVNPYAKTQKQLELSRCDLDEYLHTVDQHFNKISPLHRRAFAVIQAKCMHMMHTAYIDLKLRNLLPPLPKGVSQWSFSGFVVHHRPELETWFNQPHFVSRCLHEISRRLEEFSTATTTIPPSMPTPQPVVPLLATHFIGFDDFNAGKHWASMAEMSTLSHGKLTGGFIAKYLGEQGCVQLGPTRVFLVSDTMQTGTIQACLQAMYESLKCTKLRWLHTSPHPTAYVYDRPLFAVQYSEHLAKSNNCAIFRNISQVMLDGKLNPAMAEAKARAAAEKLLAEKQAQTDKLAAAASAIMSPNSTIRAGASGTNNNAGGAEGPGGRRPNLRSGFVGRTIGTRSRAGSQQPGGGAPSPAPESESGQSQQSQQQPATARGRIMSHSSIASDATTAATSGGSGDGGGGTVTPPSASTTSKEELNTMVMVHQPSVAEKLAIRASGFQSFSSSGNSPSQSSKGSPSAGTSFVSSHIDIINLHSDSSVLHGVSAPGGGGGGGGSSSKSSSQIIPFKNERIWFGTSWTELDQRFSAELITAVKDDSGSLHVCVAARGVDDPTPMVIDLDGMDKKVLSCDVVGGGDNSSNKDTSSAVGGGTTTTATSSLLGTTNDTNDAAAGRGSRASEGGSPGLAGRTNSIHSSSSPTKMKKPLSGIALLLGRFPTRTSPIVPDVRSFRTTDVKVCRVVVTLPLKKVNSQHSFSDKGGAGKSGGGFGDSGSVGAGASSSRNFGSNGMIRGVSTLNPVQLGGSSSRGPQRSQSRITRSMSRVSGASMNPGHGGSISSKPRGSTAMGDEDEDEVPPETPPPDVTTLIATPEETFKKLFQAFPFDEAMFVRYPALSLGGTPWLEALDQLIRESYLHMSRGADDVCTVVSVSSSDDIFFALVVALVHGMLFTEETLGMKARAATAQRDRSTGVSINDIGSKSSSGAATGGGGGGGGGGGNREGSSSPERRQDNISKLSTGLDKKASRRFNVSHHAPPPDTEDFTMPTPTPEETEAFHCITKFLENHEQDSTDLQMAQMELELMIHKCGLWTTFKMPIIESKRRAEQVRGTLDCRQHIREACCGLERYLWLVAVTRCLMDFRMSNPRLFHQNAATTSSSSLSIQKGQETPLLTAFIEWRLGKSFFAFLFNGIDPFKQRPKLSPDPVHAQTYSMWPQRWYRAMFTPSIV